MQLRCLCLCVCACVTWRTGSAVPPKHLFKKPGGVVKQVYKRTKMARIRSGKSVTCCNNSNKTAEFTEQLQGCMTDWHKICSEFHRNNARSQTCAAAQPFQDDYIVQRIHIPLRLYCYSQPDLPVHLLQNWSAQTAWRHETQACWNESNSGWRDPFSFCCC